MKLKLPRYRWLLLIACLAAVAIGVISWQLTVPPAGRFTREQYDRIRVGMTPAEVASAVGSGPSSIEVIQRIPNRGHWQTVASEETRPPIPYDKTEGWVDESVIIEVGYWQGKAVLKMMETPRPAWKDWLPSWLVGR
jgi:hypothetical protein